jgi:1-pyrroline-5-carboxylate dehydrogenase
VSENPSHPSEVVGLHHKASAELAQRAIEDAHAYAPVWGRTAPADRAALVLRVAALIRERKFEFDAWLVTEAGKTWPEAEADVSEAIDFCDYYARQMLRMAAPEPLVQLPGERDQLTYLPLGAGIVIPPWNFPLAILAGMTVAALVAGNTVVIKPSSETPTIAAKFVEVLHAAGFPPRSFALCTGSGSVIGDLLVEHPRTRFVSFTGSREVGLRINQLAAQPRKGQVWIKRVVAEMGGKDAIIVDREADLESAVAGVAQSAFGYQGQKCSACSRAILVDSIHDALLAKIVVKTNALKVGDPVDNEMDMGPLTGAEQLEKVLSYLDTTKVGGRIVTGGVRIGDTGYFVAPTVVADVKPTDRLATEEVFGPVLAVIRAKDWHEALAIANGTEFGLTGSVFSKDAERLEEAKKRFHVGNLYLNRKCTGALVGAQPFGGFDMSGTCSKAGGPDYLGLFLQQKSIAIRKV